MSQQQQQQQQSSLHQTGVPPVQIRPLQHQQQQQVRQPGQQQQVSGQQQVHAQPNRQPLQPAQPAVRQPQVAPQVQQQQHTSQQVHQQHSSQAQPAVAVPPRQPGESLPVQPSRQPGHVKQSDPTMSWATVGALLLLGLAIFIGDPLHKRGPRTKVVKDTDEWKTVPVSHLETVDTLWSKDKPFDWPNAKRLVVFGDETVSSAAGNAHGNPTGLNSHKGLRWTDYLFKSFMNDDALYHNLATVGSTAADIENQIKAFKSLSTVQGSNFRAEDTLFVFGSGEAGVKPLDGSKAKSKKVSSEVKDLMTRATALYKAGGRSFLFLTLREAGEDQKARKHYNAELLTALEKFKKQNKEANVMLFRYSDWFDALRGQPDLVGITECARDIMPDTQSARLGFCIDTFGDETWPVDRLLSHAVNGYLVKHSRSGSGNTKTDAKGRKMKSNKA